METARKPQAARPSGARCARSLRSHAYSERLATHGSLRSPRVSRRRSARLSTFALALLVLTVAQEGPSALPRSVPTCSGQPADVGGIERGRALGSGRKTLPVFSVAVSIKRLLLCENCQGFFDVFSFVEDSRLDIGRNGHIVSSSRRSTASNLRIRSSCVPTEGASRSNCSRYALRVSRSPMRIWPVSTA